MHSLLVYSSMTGNTKAVAEAIVTVLPAGTPIVTVKEAPSPDKFDCLLLGFWVHRALPDPFMWRYMETVREKNVFFFGTMAAWPDSEHACKVRDSSIEHLAGNRILDHFFCQGKLAPKRFEARMNSSVTNAGHPMTPERKARLIEASKHPNEEDFQKARAAVSSFLDKAGALAKS